jgi:hypothetical protein
MAPPEFGESGGCRNRLQSPHHTRGRLQQVVSLHHAALLPLQRWTLFRRSRHVLDLGPHVDLPLPPTLQHLDLWDTWLRQDAASLPKHQIACLVDSCEAVAAVARAILLPAVLHQASLWVLLQCLGQAGASEQSGDHDRRCSSCRRTPACWAVSDTSQSTARMTWNEAGPCCHCLSHHCCVLTLTHV